MSFPKILALLGLRFSHMGQLLGARKWRWRVIRVALLGHLSTSLVGEWQSTRQRKCASLKGRCWAKRDGRWECTGFGIRDRNFSHDLTSCWPNDWKKNHLILLSIQFSICKMGIKIVLNSQSSYEDNMCENTCKTVKHVQMLRSINSSSTCRHSLGHHSLVCFEE